MIKFALQPFGVVALPLSDRMEAGEEPLITAPAALFSDA
jgi:hypothetical protein